MLDNIALSLVGGDGLDCGRFNDRACARAVDCAHKFGELLGDQAHAHVHTLVVQRRIAERTDGDGVGVVELQDQLHRAGCGCWGGRGRGVLLAHARSFRALSQAVARMLENAVTV